MTSSHIDMYRAAQQRRRAALLRGDDTEEFDAVIAAIWRMMSESDRRIVLGVGEISRAA